MQRLENLNTMLIGLTGGIASGKSTFCRIVLDASPFAYFDADSCVHELLSSHPGIIAAIQEEFSLPADRPLDRKILREAVFADPSKRARLEAILHPAVRQRWQVRAEACRQSNTNFLADIPLLFETAAAGAFDATVVVAAETATQRARMAARGLGAPVIDAMLASQWPMRQKVALADYVIWNDGSEAELRRQASLLLQQILPPAA